jgi:hypothetical protein
MFGKIFVKLNSLFVYRTFFILTPSEKKLYNYILYPQQSKFPPTIDGWRKRWRGRGRGRWWRWRGRERRRCTKRR